MKLEQAINKYFSRDNLIDSICKYQLYYQIGLGSLALQSIQDLEETHKKLAELNLQIDSRKVFEAIHEIVLYLSAEENFEEKFENHLKFTALTQMLNDFVQADKELIGSEHFSNMIYEQIKDDKYFTFEMQQQLDVDYKTILPTWKATITDEIANDIKDVVTEIFAKE
jgi:hypothetical protein